MRRGGMGSKGSKASRDAGRSRSAAISCSEHIRSDQCDVTASGGSCRVDAPVPALPFFDLIGLPRRCVACRVHLSFSLYIRGDWYQVDNEESATAGFMSD